MGGVNIESALDEKQARELVTLSQRRKLVSVALLSRCAHLTMTAKP